MTEAGATGGFLIKAADPGALWDATLSSIGPIRKQPRRNAASLTPRLRVGAGVQVSSPNRTDNIQMRMGAGVESIKASPWPHGEGEGGSPPSAFDEVV